MIEFINKHSKVLTVSFVFVIMVAVLVSVSSSLATDEYDGKIYTRDELSELVTPSNMFLTVYPIGSIYLSVNNVNPSTIYGGSWIPFGNGKTIVGVDPSQDEFSAVEKVGGEKTHTLTIPEMPSHAHRVTSEYGTDYWALMVWSSTIPDYFPGGIAFNESMYGYWPGSHATGNIERSGGSQSHNNLQPYITVYMWKRTA